MRHYTSYLILPAIYIDVRVNMLQTNIGNEQIVTKIDSNIESQHRKGERQRLAGGGGGLLFILYNPIRSPDHARLG